MIIDYRLANLLYRLCYILGFVACFGFNAFYAKKYQLRPGKMLLFSIVSYALIFGWSYILAFVMNGFSWGHHNAIRVYIWFPLVLLLTTKLFHVDCRTCLEYIAPSTCIVYGIARLGCVFAGCCHGYPVVHGMYSVSAGCRCFPVQLCEALTALAIAALIIRMALRKKYSAEKCILYPTMLTLYGGTRFLWEFFADNKKVIGRISELALWALATCIIGLVWLLICKKRNPQGVKQG